MWGAGVEEKSFWGQSEVHVCPEPSGAEGASRRRGRLGPELGLATRPAKHTGTEGGLGSAQCPSCGGLPSCPQ